MQVLKLKGFDKKIDFDEFFEKYGKPVFTKSAFKVENYI